MSWTHILMYWTFLGCQRQKMEWRSRCKSKHTWISAIFEAQELGFDGWSDAKVSVHFIVQCAPLQTNTKTLFSCTDPQQEAMRAPAHLCTSHCCTHKLLHYTLDSELWTLHRVLWHVGQCSVLPSASLLTMNFCSLCMHTTTIQPLLICHSNLSRAWHTVGMPAYTRLCNHTVGFVGILYHRGHFTHKAVSTLKSAIVTELHVVGNPFPHWLQGLRCQFDRSATSLKVQKERGAHILKRD